MLLRSYIFKRITIVGVGFMGGSLGLAIKKNRLAREVIGLSHRQTALAQAVQMKAIDVPCLDVKKAIGNADLVVLAAPVDSIIKLCSTINPYLRRHCIVTDIGSAKANIVDSAERVLSNPSLFVGSHPLTGSEKSGVGSAVEDLFNGAKCVITPTAKTSQAARQKIKYFWTKLGMDVRILSPQEHDEILAYVSHLPHLLAYGLISGIPPNFLEYASRGLKDTCRIAASSPQLWSDICIANSKNVLNALDKDVELLAHFRKAIVNHDHKELLHLFTKAQEMHRKIE